MSQQHACARQYLGWRVAGGTLGAALMVTVIAAEPSQPFTPVAPSSAKPPISAPANSTPRAIPPPDCAQGITPAEIEGPYYKLRSPERVSLLEPGMAGIKITLTGLVLSRSCQPIAGAWLDFWQANDQGDYDNRGYTLRGHQFTDANGQYTLQTILPGRYSGRPPHIHVKVRAPGQSILTTQLYFPEAQQYNRNDPFFDPRLLVTWLEPPENRTAVYHFVLDQP